MEYECAIISWPKHKFNNARLLWFRFGFSLRRRRNRCFCFFCRTLYSIDRAHACAYPFYIYSISCIKHVLIAFGSSKFLFFFSLFFLLLLSFCCVFRALIKQDWITVCSALALAFQKKNNAANATSAFFCFIETEPVPCQCAQQWILNLCTDTDNLIGVRIHILRSCQWRYENSSWSPFF